MIISIALIVAFIMGVSPWVLFGLLITWIPDIVIVALLFGRDV